MLGSEVDARAKLCAFRMMRWGNAPVKAVADAVSEFAIPAVAGAVDSACADGSCSVK